MDVSAHYDPVLDAYQVRIRTGVDPDGVAWYLTNQGRERVAVRMGLEIPVYLTVPIEIADALGRALLDDQKRDTIDGDEHLADAINIRDRLLTMIEKVVDNDVSS